MNTYTIFAVREPDGLYRLTPDPPSVEWATAGWQYADPASPPFVRFRVTAAAPPALPGELLSMDECRRWYGSVAAGGGGWAVPTGPSRALDLIYPSPPDDARVSVHPELVGDEPTLAAVVVNECPHPLRGLAVRWQVEYAAFGTPEEAAAAAAGTGLGGSADLAHPGGRPDLEPGGRATFVLPLAELRGVLSEAAALGSGRYWLGVWAGDREIHREPGTSLAPVLDRLDD